MKQVHIVCAVAQVGGAFHAQRLTIRVARSPDPGDLPKAGRHIEFLGRLGAQTKARPEGSGRALLAGTVRRGRGRSPRPSP